jgi:hypothetical protein
MTTILRALFLGCLCAAVVASGCGAAFGTPSIKGSGVVASEAREVAGFTDVRVNGSGEVVIEQTGDESLSVEAEDNILPLLETKVSDGVLRLGTKPNVSINTTRPIRYRITVKQLTGVGIAGSGSIRASGIETKTLAVNISGSGSAHLVGKADAADLRISGSGSYDAEKLQAGTVRVNISGSGGATVNATDRLDATVSGSGSVKYVGTPTVQKHISGSGSVARR